MLKYKDVLVGFQEVPDEISLCINITNCPNNCIGCHSPYLAEDIGTKLNRTELYKLIQDNKGITCVCLMGGDSDPSYINILAIHIHKVGLKSAWYSGKTNLSNEIDINNFDYIKLGPYIEEFGPLNNPNTNQIMYKITDNELENITYKFWK